ncbi:hypothetical protein HDV64DRAFT_184554 [Trichoderma sp. TUCIM 5745]
MAKGMFGLIQRDYRGRDMEHCSSPHVVEHCSASHRPDKPCSRMYAHTIPRALERRIRGCGQ